MQNQKKKIVFIGNSIVNGFPWKRSQCFVSLYREATGHNVINKGINGSTTPEALERFSHDVIDHHPEEFWFLGGTNDFIMKVCEPEETMAGYRQMAEWGKKNRIRPVFLIPLMVEGRLASVHWDSSVDYEEVTKKLLKLREMMLDYGTENNIQVVDLFHFYRSLYTEETMTDYLLDGLHPTTAGHKAIADYLVSLQN